MTSSDPALPLLTDTDVHRRVETLVGRAVAGRTLWVLWLDGDQRQAPVVMPVDDVPARPTEVLDGLGRVLAGIHPDMATATGPGSVVFALERRGPGAATADDRAWADGLAGMCDRVGVPCRGIFASTSEGLRSLR